MCLSPRMTNRMISISIHVHDKNAQAVHAFVIQHILPQRFRLSYVKDNSGHFPINRLRNVAINNTITSHFWLTDVDIWPACCSPSLFSLVADLYETILSLPSSLLAIDKQAIVVPVYEVLPISVQMKASNKERVQNGNSDCTDLQACLFKFMRSVRVRHRHLYAVPHHREELMSCLQFGPCEQFKKNRKTHVHFQQCIHQLVLHQLRAMGEDDKSIQVPLRCGMLQE